MVEGLGDLSHERQRPPSKQAVVVIGGHPGAAVSTLQCDDLRVVAIANTPLERIDFPAACAWAVTLRQTLLMHRLGQRQRPVGGHQYTTKPRPVPPDLAPVWEAFQRHIKIRSAFGVARCRQIVADCGDPRLYDFLLAGTTWRGSAPGTLAFGRQLRIRDPSQGHRLAIAAGLLCDAPLSSAVAQKLLATCPSRVRIALYDTGDVVLPLSFLRRVRGLVWLDIRCAGPIEDIEALNTLTQLRGLVADVRTPTHDLRFLTLPGLSEVHGSCELLLPEGVTSVRGTPNP